MYFNKSQNTAITNKILKIRQTVAFIGKLGFILSHLNINMHTKFNTHIVTTYTQANYIIDIHFIANATDTFTINDTKHFTFLG